MNDRPAVRALAPHITQIGVVVTDLIATMDAYRRILGWGPWNVYRHQPPQLHDLTFRGEPANFSMLTAETTVGALSFELIQPLEGRSPYSEWLETNGDGLHHVACQMASDSDTAELIETLRTDGLTTLASGRLGERLAFYYFDGAPALKLILETGTGYDDSPEPVWTYPSPSYRHVGQPH